MSTYRVDIRGCEPVIFRANFAEASDPIMVCGDDGEWISTPYQVADFQHSAQRAGDQLAAELIRDGGDDPDDCTWKVREIRGES